MGSYHILVFSIRFEATMSMHNDSPVSADVVCHACTFPWPCCLLCKLFLLAPQRGRITSLSLAIRFGTRQHRDSQCLDIAQFLSSTLYAVTLSLLLPRICAPQLGPMPPYHIQPPLKRPHLKPLPKTQRPHRCILLLRRLRRIGVLMCSTIYRILP